MSHPLASLVSDEIKKAHKASWYCMAWDGRGNVEWFRHTSTMRGEWGHDVKCSCGWESRTGGATRRSVEDDLWQHRSEMQYAKDNPEYARVLGITEDQIAGRKP
jgi:hypothetical protein